MPKSALRDLEELVSKIEGLQIPGHDRSRIIELLGNFKAVIIMLIENTPCQIFWKNRDLVYVGCNQLFADITDMGTPEAVVGKTDFDFHRDSEFAESYRQWDRQVMESGQAVIGLEEEYHRFDGTKGTVLTSKVPLRNESGEVFGILGICTDITERKQLEKKREALLAELAEALKRIQHLSDQKSQFLQLLSHDLRTPLTSVLLSTELLLTSATNAENRRKILGIQDACKSMMELLTHILNVERIETRQLCPESVELNLAAVLRERLEHFSPAIMRKNQTLKVAGDASLRVIADPKYLGMVIDNLVSNAVKFSPIGKTIRVSIAPEGSLGTFCVADEGPGFSDADKSQVFTHFVKLSAKPTAGEPSVGLGLSIVKHLVDAMNGHIVLESQFGEGATFTVRLPLARLA